MNVHGYRFKLFEVLLLCIMAVAVSVSCTRQKDEDKNVKFTIAIPNQMKAGNQKVGSLALGQMKHFIINVYSSASGGALLGYMNWDGHAYVPGVGETLVAPPASVTLDIPNGSGRLVQLLTVHNDATTSAMVFGYGDSVVDLNGGETTVTITPSQVGGGIQTTGDMVGRYLTAPGEGPTGPLEIYVQPDASKPKILVMFDYIFSGYFQAFFIDDSFFSYYLRDQATPMFTSTSFDVDTLTTGNSLMRINSPPYYIRSCYGGGSCTGELREGKDIVAGYIPAPGSTFSMAGYSVTYPSSLQAIADAYLVYNAASTLSGGFSSQVNFNPSPSGSTDIHRMSGGIASSASSVFPNEYTNYMNLKPQRFGSAGWGKGLLGFNGPYQYFSTTNNGNAIYDYQYNTPSAGDFKLSWKYISSEVFNGPNAITGTRIFYRENSNQNDLDQYKSGFEDIILCSALAGAGFTEIDIPYDGTLSTNDQEVVISGLASLNTTSFVICPMRGAEDIDFGMKVYAYSNSGGGPGGLKLAYIGSSSQSGGGCLPISFAVKDGLNNTTTLATASTVSFNWSTFDGISSTVYSDTGCTTFAASSNSMSGGSYQFVMNSGDSGKTFSMRSNPAAYTISAVPTNFMSTTDVLGFYVPGVPPMMSKADNLPTATAQGACYPFYAQMKTGSNLPAVASSVVTSYISLMSNSAAANAGNFFLSKDCTGTPQGYQNVALTFNPGEWNQQISFQPTTATSQTYSMQSALGGTLHNDGTMQFGGNTIATYKFVFNGNYNYAYSNSCQSVQIHTQNNVGADISVGANTSVSGWFTVPASATTIFYTDAGCTAVASTMTATIYSGSSWSDTWFVRPNSSITHNSMISVSGTTMSGSVTVY